MRALAVVMMVWGAACDAEPSASRDRCAAAEARCGALGREVCSDGQWVEAACESDSVCVEGMCKGVGRDFFAVMLDDSVQLAASATDPCVQSAASPGADIDAVALYDGGTLIGYLEHVRFAPSALCPDNQFVDGDQAVGAPDASAAGGFVALGGGTLVGDFGAGVQIHEGYTIEVLARDEGPPGCALDCGPAYSIYVTSALDCTRTRPDCRTVLLADRGVGPTEVVVPAL